MSQFPDNDEIERAFGGPESGPLGDDHDSPKSMSDKIGDGDVEIATETLSGSEEADLARMRAAKVPPITPGRGGVAPELEEAGDMGTSDGLGCPVDGCALPRGHDSPHCRRPLAAQLTRDDAERLGGIAGQLEEVAASAMWRDADRNVRYLRELARRARGGETR